MLNIAKAILDSVELPEGYVFIESPSVCEKCKHDKVNSFYLRPNLQAGHDRAVVAYIVGPSGKDFKLTIEPWETT